MPLGGSSWMGKVENQAVSKMLAKVSKILIKLDMGYHA